jgi:hypothetical protein
MFIAKVKGENNENNKAMLERKAIKTGAVESLFNGQRHFLANLSFLLILL